MIRPTITIPNARKILTEYVHKSECLLVLAILHLLLGIIIIIDLGSIYKTLYTKDPSL